MALKMHEQTQPDSCLAKADQDEMIFVLRAKDPAAPAAIRHWIAKRLELGKDAPDSPKIQEAFECAAEMDRQRESGKFA